MSGIRKSSRIAASSFDSGRVCSLHAIEKGAVLDEGVESTLVIMSAGPSFSQRKRASRASYERIGAVGRRVADLSLEINAAGLAPRATMRRVSVAIAGSFLWIGVVVAVATAGSFRWTVAVG